MESKSVIAGFLLTLTTGALTGCIAETTDPSGGQGSKEMSSVQQHVDIPNCDKTVYRVQSGCFTCDEHQASVCDVSSEGYGECRCETVRENCTMDNPYCEDPSSE
jgi:hypothetical protein